MCRRWMLKKGSWCMRKIPFVTSFRGHKSPITATGWSGNSYPLLALNTKNLESHHPSLWTAPASIADCVRRTVPLMRLKWKTENHFGGSRNVISAYAVCITVQLKRSTTVIPPEIVWDIPMILLWKLLLHNLYFVFGIEASEMMGYPLVCAPKPCCKRVFAFVLMHHSAHEIKWYRGPIFIFYKNITGKPVTAPLFALLDKRFLAVLFTLQPIRFL